MAKKAGASGRERESGGKDVGDSPALVEAERLHDEAELARKGAKDEKGPGHAPVLAAAGSLDGGVLPNSVEATRGPVNTSGEDLREAHGLESALPEPSGKGGGKPKGAVRIYSDVPRFTLGGRQYRDDGFPVVQPDDLTDEEWARVHGNAHLTIKKAGRSESDL